MDHRDIQLQKAVLWEEAKSKLRAMVIVDGYQRLSDDVLTSEREREVMELNAEIDRHIESFISDVEDHGYNE